MEDLSEQLRELAELEKAGVRVLGEVTLRQHAETQKLLIVLAQMGEVAGQAGAGGHEIRDTLTI